ncbi:RNA polymerase sigma factor [Caballeronia fortuita]|uniref:RNA polymerase sigma factor n=1 Tax=Caballeronia fortuita TaxID=1777138 RepID=A0A158DH64_9BURK|nr:RNA polymerase sigma factor [Caballeronia fortuita]
MRLHRRAHQAQQAQQARRAGLQAGAATDGACFHRFARARGRTALSFESDLLAHLPQLRRYARALTGDRAWADDLVQDATERALNRAKSFHAGTNLRAWLFTIMRNLYIDQLRGRRDIAVDDETAPWRQMAAPRGEVDGLVLRDVQRALYCLPVEQREVMLLVCVEEMSYQEASVVLNVPTGTVMSRLSRAREHMRVLLGEESGRKASPSSLKVVSRS